MKRGIVSKNDSRRRIAYVGVRGSPCDSVLKGKGGKRWSKHDIRNRRKKKSKVRVEVIVGVIVLVGVRTEVEIRE